MMSTYSRALAPGTYLNRAKQAKFYVTFCVLYNVPPLFPGVLSVCMYSQYLANAFQAVSSVKNYISGARTWVHEHGGNPTAFGCTQLDHMIKSITKDSTHVVKRAFPLSIPHLSAICLYLDASKTTPLCVKSCILIGYSCYLRSSNLFLPSLELSHNHTLCAKDVTLVQGGLKIVINSTKSRGKPYTIIVNTNSDINLCPVTAWVNYISSLNLRPGNPAFMLNATTPLSPVLVVRLMRDALRVFPDLDVSTVSMHSIRRGAAQTAERNGSAIPDIMKRGGWKSKSGLKPYLTS